MKHPDESAFRKRMGWHVRSLRRARGLTQERFAELCQLSGDTVRRLELGSFSPSVGTLRAVTNGCGLSLGTFFDSLEIGEQVIEREIADLVAGRPHADLQVVLVVLHELLRALDRRGPVGSDPESVE